MACNPDRLSRELYNLAKGNFNRSVFWKVIIYVIGISALLIKDTYSLIPLMALCSLIISEFYQYRSDNFKRAAESLRRKLDFHSSFGWELSKQEICDILARVPDDVEKKAAVDGDVGYFASTKAPGAVKALDNLEESAWYSKQQAEIVFNYCIIIVSFIMILSAASLYIAFNVKVEESLLPKISKIITSTVMVIFSIGLVRLALGYHRFKERSGQIDASAIAKLKAKDLTEVEALKLWSEYHIARASSPLIPEVIWNRNADRLNRLFNEHRKDS